MRPTDLEALIPGLKEARHAEHLNRSLCFAGVPWTVCGFEVIPMTPRHRLELQLVANPFFVGGRLPNKADVYQILWRLHPKFTRRGIAFGFSLAKAGLWWRVRQMTKETQMDAALGLADYLNAMRQDLPGSSEGEAVNEHYVHWLALEMAFYLKNYPGFTRESYMDTPYLVLQQLFRAYQMEKQEHPLFVNKSDRLVGLWQKQHAKAPKNS